jgi:hypothetical protein
LSKSSLLSR